LADKRYIISRHKANPSPPFPEIPRWSSDAICAGFIYLNATANEVIDLVEVRDDLSAIWQTEVDGTPILIVQFHSLQNIPKHIRSRSLALKAISATTLSSFAMETQRVQSRTLTDLYSVNLWWNGKRHNFSPSHLDRISLVHLWSQPIITVRNSQMFERIAVSETAEVSAQTSQKTSRKATVKKAKTPISGEGQSIFDTTDKRLNDMHQQFTLKNIFSRLIRQRVVGKGGKEEKTQAKGRGPGLLESMTGWVRWHSPFGSKLAEQFGDRMSLVEKLINSGDIDRALKLALKLGGADKIKGKSRFPSRLPNMRSGLDFKVGSDGFSMPILGFNAQASLAARYRKLAKELEEKGDFRRAAYIHSQLLDNHLEGVLTLERGGLYEIAAKLALDSRQNPALIIRLYYKAGKKDEALALAKRTDCFERLVEDSRPKDKEYHNYVVKAWTDMLLASDQPLRALEVTDELASGHHNTPPDPGLISDRIRWLGTALHLQSKYFNNSAASFPTDLMARAILCGPWDEMLIDGAKLGDFPNANLRETGPYAKVFEAFQDSVNGTKSGNMSPLLTAITKNADKHRVDQSQFWDGPSKIIINRFTRNYLAQSSDNLIPSDMSSLKQLVRNADLPVLATDLGKIKAFKKMGQQHPNVYTLPSHNEAAKSKIEVACILNNGSIVVWYDTDRLELRNNEGKVLWNKQVSRIKALIPVGASPSVMIVQGFNDGQIRLTRLETHKRRFRDIGLLHLVAWHDAMSDGQWLVQIDNLVGAIDVEKLCKEAPELEFLWTVETSNDLQIMAFNNTNHGPAWLTMNISGVRFGVMQFWRYPSTGDLETQLCLPNESNGKIFDPEIYFQWNASGWFGFVGEINNHHVLSFSRPNYDSRKKAIKFAETRRENGYVGHDKVQVLDFNRRPISIPNEKTMIIGERTEKFTLVSDDSPDFHILARGTQLGFPGKSDLTDISHICICTDKYGRLIRVNSKDRRVEIL